MRQEPASVGAVLNQDPQVKSSIPGILIQDSTPLYEMGYVIFKTGGLRTESHTGGCRSDPRLVTSDLRGFGPCYRGVFNWSKSWWLVFSTLLPFRKNWRT